MYKEKDSDTRAQFWVVEGNASRSAQLTGLGKYVLYEIRVLAFTRIGDGVPSNPPILERTLDDGRYPTTHFLFGHERGGGKPGEKECSGMELEAVQTK